MRIELNTVDAETGADPQAIAVDTDLASFLTSFRLDPVLPAIHGRRILTVVIADDDNRMIAKIPDAPAFSAALLGAEANEINRLDALLSQQSAELARLKAENQVLKDDVESLTAPAPKKTANKATPKA